MPGNYSHTTRADGSILTGSIYNGDHQNHITFATPGGLDDYSTNVAQMQSMVDPGEVGTESLATDLAGELQRIRFIQAESNEQTYWHQSRVYLTTIASATTPNIYALGTGQIIDYTGTATCTGFVAAPKAGMQRTLVCAGAAVFTAGANMLIDGITSGSNFTAAAGDKLYVIAVTTTQFRLTPAKYDGTAVIATSSFKVNEFRLSLTTGLPVTTADVTAAGTLYAVPYVGNGIALYDGTRWNIRTSAQFSLAMTLTSGKPYDIFCYDNAGVPTLEVLVWTNDTTRATALVYQDGVLCKTGQLTRRYLGTLYASGADITEDSLAKRYLWNYYHRMDRPMKVVEGTNSWTYTTLAYRQVNAAASNQLDYIQGVSEDAVHAEAMGISGTSGTNVIRSTGIGLDSTSVNSASLWSGGAPNDQGSNDRTMTKAIYRGFPGVGRHTLVWLESSVASGTTTWYGDDGASTTQTGILGMVRG